MKKKISTPASIKKKKKAEDETKKQEKLKKMGEDLKSWLNKPDVKNRVKKLENIKPEETLLQNLTVDTNHTVQNVNNNGLTTREWTGKVVGYEPDGQLSSDGQLCDTEMVE